MSGQGYPDDAVPDLLYCKGRPKIFTGNVTAGSEVTLDVNAALGKNGHFGFIDMPQETTNNLHVRISDDSVNFMGGETEGSSEYHTTYPTGGLSLDRMDVDSIKLDASAGTIAYRVIVW